MRTPHLVLAIALAAGGFTLGFVSGRRAPSTPATPSPSSPAASPQAQPPVERPSSADAGDSDVVRKQQAEIRRLETRVRELESQLPAPKTRESKLALAKEIYADFVDVKNRKSRDPEKMVRLLGRLDELDPDMTAWFIEQYRQHDGEEREVAFVLAMIAGGPDGGRFASDLLSQSDLPEATRRQLLRALAGLDDMPARITVDESLARTGEDLMSSSLAEERAAGAGIAGLRGDPAAVSRLRGLAETDPNGTTRAAAFVALGRIGDATVLAWMKAYASSGSLDQRTQQAVARAVTSLEERLGR